MNLVVAFGARFLLFCLILILGALAGLTLAAFLFFWIKSLIRSNGTAREAIAPIRFFLHRLIMHDAAINMGISVGIVCLLLLTTRAYMPTFLFFIGSTAALSVPYATHRMLLTAQTRYGLAAQQKQSFGELIGYFGGGVIGFTMVSLVLLFCTVLLYFNFASHEFVLMLVSPFCGVMISLLISDVLSRFTVHQMQPTDEQIAPKTIVIGGMCAMHGCASYIAAIASCMIAAAHFFGPAALRFISLPLLLGIIGLLTSAVGLFFIYLLYGRSSVRTEVALALSGMFFWCLSYAYIRWLGGAEELVVLLAPSSLITFCLYSLYAQWKISTLWASWIMRNVLIWCGIILFVLGYQYGGLYSAMMVSVLLLAPMPLYLSMTFDGIIIDGASKIFLQNDHGSERVDQRVGMLMDGMSTICLLIATFGTICLLLTPSFSLDPLQTEIHAFAGLIMGGMLVNLLEHCHVVAYQIKSVALSLGATLASAIIIPILLLLSPMHIAGSCGYLIGISLCILQNWQSHGTHLRLISHDLIVRAGLFVVSGYVLLF